MSGWLERRRLPIGNRRPGNSGKPKGSPSPGGGDGGGSRGRGRGRGGAGTPQVLASSSNWFTDAVLQLAFKEADTSTSGVDESVNAFNWTGVGDAAVSSNRLVLDGTGDYATLASDANDWNFFHDGAPWTVEFIVVGRPSAASNTVIDTTGSSSSNRGVWVATTSTGTVRVLLSRAVGGQPQADITTTFTIPNDAAEHHVVIEYDPGDATGSTEFWFGMDGTRQESGALSLDSPSISDATADARIGSLATAASLLLNGSIRGIRIWKDHLHYDLANNASYTAEDDPSVWATSETGTTFWSFPPRFFPKEETTSLGKTDGHFYRSESRFLDVSTEQDGSNILAFMHCGPTHGANTTMQVEMFRSTDYGRSFPYSTQVVVGSDGTRAARNHAVGRDSSSGRLICFYRLTNGSDVTQDVGFKTSTDNGATWGSFTSVASSLTAGSRIPFGKIVSTSNGLMAVFYDADFAEALFSTDGGQTWGSRTTIYDETGAPLGYNEPFLINDGDTVVAISRKDDANNNDFVWYKSSDGGSTWGSGTEAAWTVSNLSDANPISACVVGNNVVTVWCGRPSDYGVYYTVSNKSQWFNNPARGWDGTDTVTTYYGMRQFTVTATDDEYGYADVLPMGTAAFLLSFYQPVRDSNTVTRCWNALVDIQ